MKISLVIAVYKDIEALSLIINALRKQTDSNFEVIVAEDNNSLEMREFIASVKGIDIKHTTQDDIGIRKARSQNNAILAATGEYLIFIDGDCIPYTTFIEGHRFLAKKGQVLAGRRLNLGPKYSNLIRKHNFDPVEIEKGYFFRLPSLIKDADESHVEAGFSMHPNSFVFQKLVYPKSPSIVGCNFSCFREDIISINGFDESYGETSLPDDTDIEWRLRAFGLSIQSCKFAANQFHLHHARSSRDYSGTQYLADMLDRKGKGIYTARVGLNAH